MTPDTIILTGDEYRDLRALEDLLSELARMDAPTDERARAAGSAYADLRTLRDRIELRNYRNYFANLAGVTGVAV